MQNCLFMSHHYRDAMEIFFASGDLKKKVQKKREKEIIVTSF